MTDIEQKVPLDTVRGADSNAVLGYMSMIGAEMNETAVHTGAIVGVTGGMGSIGAHGIREPGHEVDDTFVAQVAQEIADGEFNTEISAENGPCSSGGTFTMVVADALTGRYLYRPGMNAAEHSQEVYGYLRQAIEKNPDLKKIIPSVCIDGRMKQEGSLPNTTGIGGHRDEHAHGANCGCGAEDKFGDTPATEDKPAQMGSLRYLAEQSDVIRGDLASLGVQVDDETHQLIVTNAKDLYANNYAVSGQALSEAMQTAAGGASSTPTLAGVHFELLAHLQTSKDKTLDREALAARYGVDCQAFEVNIGTFPDAAAVVALTERGAQQYAAAMLYFNIAVAKILTHKDLPIALS